MVMTSDMASAGARRRIPWRLIGWGGAALLLLLPLVAGAPWTVADFLFAGVVFGLVGAGIELAVRKGNAAYSMGAGVALGASLLSVWITGAVGIIGNEADDANILYIAVVMLALLGAIASLFRPSGMAIAMASAALAELLVPVAAWLLWPELRDAILQPEVPLMGAFLTGMWAVSAWLFRKSAREIAA
jgi:hypothetical protein